MNASQDVSFCVPVYSQAESASDSQVRDHSGSQQDQEVSGGLVPVFCPSWRDKPHTGLEKRKEEAPYNASLVSSLSLGHMDDKRLGSGHVSADVGLHLPKLGHRCAGLPMFRTQDPRFMQYSQERETGGNSMVSCCEPANRTDVSCTSYIWDIMIRAHQHGVLQTYKDCSDDLDFEMVLNRMDSAFLRSPSDGRLTPFTCVHHACLCIAQAKTALSAHLTAYMMFQAIRQLLFLVVPVLVCDAGVVPDMSPTVSTSSHVFPVGSDSAYEQTFSMLQASFMNPDVQPSSCLNPYFASYDQELLPCAFTKRGLSGQDHRAPSHFIPTSSNTASMSLVPTSQAQQGSHSLRPGSGASYSIPKDVLHVGEDKPMAREARVARCVCCST